MSVHVTIPRKRQDEGNNFTATVYSRSGDSSSVPTTLRYRIDCLSTGEDVVGWTTITPAASATITVGSAIVNDCSYSEKKQITVESDTGLSTQSRDQATWRVINNRGFDE